MKDCMYKKAWKALILRKTFKTSLVLFSYPYIYIFWGGFIPPPLKVRSWAALVEWVGFEWEERLSKKAGLWRPPGSTYSRASASAWGGWGWWWWSWYWPSSSVYSQSLGFSCGRGGFLGSQGPVVSKKRFQGTLTDLLTMTITVMTITVTPSSPLTSLVHCFLSRDFGLIRRPVLTHPHTHFYYHFYYHYWS